MYTVIKANPIITLLGACVELTPELEARINDHAKKLENEKIDKQEKGITIVEHKSPEMICILGGSRTGKSQIHKAISDLFAKPIHIKQTYRNPQSQYPIPHIKKGNK